MPGEPVAVELPQCSIYFKSQSLSITTNKIISENLCNYNK